LIERDRELGRLGIKLLAAGCWMLSAAAQRCGGSRSRVAARRGAVGRGHRRDDWSTIPRSRGRSTITAPT